MNNPNNKKVLITSPIYYVNGVPHIGHVYTNLLCDALSRYYRLKNGPDSVLFSTGTDEHGAKVEQAAEKQGLQPKELCDQLSKVFQDTFDTFNFTYDHYIRTTDSDHEEVVKEMWGRLKEKGDIYLGHHEGWYCVADESFVTEKQVYDELDPVTNNPTGRKLSKESGRPVEWLKEPNYKFRLSNYQQPILDWLRSGPVIEPDYRKQEIIKFVEDGLRDLSVSRPKTVLKWGIDVPDDNNHVIYVWLDALFNYYTVSKGINPTPGHPREPACWPADFHIIGKDILKFHAVYWPAFLLSAGLPLPKKLFAHGWWTKDGQKIAKSTGNVIDPNSEIQKYGLDPFRYYLLCESNLSSDNNYTSQGIQNRLNSHLADDLGNLFMRSISKKLNPAQTVPHYFPAVYDNFDNTLIQELNTLSQEVSELYEALDFQQGLSKVWEVIGHTNKYINVKEPWKLQKKLLKSITATEGVVTDATLDTTINSISKIQEELDTTLYLVLESIRITSTLLLPVIPDSAKRMLDQLNVPQELRNTQLSFGQLVSGTPLNPAPTQAEQIIFKKIQEE